MPHSFADGRTSREEKEEKRKTNNLSDKYIGRAGFAAKWVVAAQKFSAGVLLLLQLSHRSRELNGHTLLPFVTYAVNCHHFVVVSPLNHLDLTSKLEEA